MESMSDSPACPPNVTATPEKPVEVLMQEWLDGLQNVTRVDMNSLIMNYLVTEGFKEAAEKFRLESGIEPTVNLDSLDGRIMIRNAIQEGHVQEAIGLINDLHPELLDNDRHLYFHLLQQHTIELIRDKNVIEALEFAQTHLAEKGMENTSVLPEIECTLALLAFEHPEASPYGDLLHPSQREKVASEVNAALLAMDNMESSSKLSNLLKLVLWTQEELDNKQAKYPKLIDIVKGTLKESK